MGSKLYACFFVMVVANAEKRLHLLRSLKLILKKKRKKKKKKNRENK